MSKARKASRHIQHYLPLLGILLAGAFGVYYFSYDRAFQAAITSAVAAGYVVWGVIHHYLHRDLHLSVIIEYIVVATLGLVIVFSLLFTA